MDNQNSFEYTYSAQQRQEVEAIRKKYLPKEENKMDRLRQLHSIPTRKAQTASLTVGILGALILGTGMSLCMTDLGSGLGSFAIILGVLLGVIGMAMTGMAYSVYSRTLKKERAKIAPEILRLTDELMQ